jgi:adenine-specific DNA-methyltransferase
MTLTHTLAPATEPVLMPAGTIHGAQVKNGTRHLLVKGDNLTALPLLAPQLGHADLVYLDPPYNTGKNEWMYGDDHDDWMAFMRDRLVAVRGLLAVDGVIAASIGYQRVHHLALLLAEIFPERRVHTITVEVSGGTVSGGVKQVAEYLLLALPDRFQPFGLPWAQSSTEARQPWEGLTLSTAPKGRWPHQVYPVIVDDATRRVISVGPSLQDMLDAGDHFDPRSFPLTQALRSGQGTTVLWPVTRHGKECSWRLSRDAFVAALDRGHVKVDPTRMPGNSNPFSVKYLPAGAVSRIAAGAIDVLGKDRNGALILRSTRPAATAIPTMWARKEHHTAKGTARLTELIGQHQFPYPKPVALITDLLTALAGPDAVILDPFAGSGTTFEAVIDLNAADGGTRRAVLITSDEGGVFTTVTRPRVQAVLRGRAGTVDVIHVAPAATHQ